jgi:hypothetical protein
MRRRAWSQLRPHHPGKVRRHFHLNIPICGQSKSLSGPQAGFSGNAARVAEIDTICPHIAFRSPERHDARSVENDWLRAGK